MKTISYCLILLALCFHAQASQQTGRESVFGHPDVLCDSPEVDYLPQESLQIKDSVLHKAYTGGGFNFRVFGRCARDDQHYRQLTERFEQADTTLMISDIFTLYYGYAYRDDYESGYGIRPWKALLDKKEANYAEAYELVLAALKNSPAIPHYLLDAINIAYQLERPDEEIRKLEWRFYYVLAIIRSTGDGTDKNPLTVVTVSDEYTFLYNYFEVEKVTGQSLTTNENGVICDCIEVEPVDNVYFKGSEVWFDITFPIITLDSPNHWANKLINEGEEN